MKKLSRDVRGTTTPTSSTTFGNKQQDRNASTNQPTDDRYNDDSSQLYGDTDYSRTHTPQGDNSNTRHTGKFASQEDAPAGQGTRHTSSERSGSNRFAGQEDEQPDKQNTGSRGASSQLSSSTNSKQNLSAGLSSDVSEEDEATGLEQRKTAQSSKSSTAPLHTKTSTTQKTPSRGAL